ncbi:phosphate acetyltransferase [Klebsiella variicola]|uniref:Phosphate acetyltransferase n=1 Tax=Klebsiella variicola TaxID=244366 RepID=A0A7H4MPN0_KLEVA|nr:phosphate acetyltransferase [Klebsiella variicola]
MQARCWSPRQIVLTCWSLPAWPAMNGVEIGAILLTGGYEMDARISKLCERAFATGLPVFMVNTNTWQTSLSLQSFNLEVPVDDHERIEKVQEYVAKLHQRRLDRIADRDLRAQPPSLPASLPLPADRAGAQSRQTRCPAGRRRTAYRESRRYLCGTWHRHLCAAGVTRMRSTALPQRRALSWARVSKSSTRKWFAKATWLAWSNCVRARA